MRERPVADLTGLRVLVVEDRTLVAMELEDILTALGCAVVGPVGNLEAAVKLAHEAELDAAVLDVDLDGDKVFPVAEVLRKRDIPFIFSTGYGGAMIPAEWRGPLRLDKPFTRAQIEQHIRVVVRR